MILEVDIGNTRLKWRLRNEEVIVQGVLNNDGIATLASQVKDYGAPEKVAVSCVAKPAIVASLEEIARAWGASLQVAATKRQACGVECGYREPQQMGVDRWLAVIAAYNQNQQACVVVDAGSAITVDLVDDKGCHKGGYIVPGLYKMRDCLYQETSQVKVVSLDSGATGKAALKPGASTGEAVSYGLFAMVEGLIGQAISQLAREGCAPKIIFTGGDAALVASLGVEGVIREHLVLDGLAIAASGEGA